MPSRPEERLVRSEVLSRSRRRVSSWRGREPEYHLPRNAQQRRAASLYGEPDPSRARPCAQRVRWRFARELEGTLFSITHEGSERIIAEHERRIAEIEALRAQDGSNAQQVDQLIAQSAAARDAQLS